MQNSILKFLRKISFKTSGNNVVIISLHKLGDTVFTIPAIKKIIATYGEDDVIVICYPDSEEIYKISEIKNVIAIPGKYFLLDGRIASIKARNKLKKLRPKKIIDLTGTITSITLTAGIGINEIIGTGNEKFKYFYDKYIPLREKPHLIDRYLDVVELDQSGSTDKIKKDFPVNFSREGKILVMPFAGWAAKEWDLDKYLSLTEKLLVDYQVEIVFNFEKKTENLKEKLIERNIPFYQSRTILNLIKKLEECSLLISNDSGPIYIANLLGKPVFTIYGPTNPEFSLPLGGNSRYIQKKIECSPQHNKQYCFTNAGRNGCPSFECMNQLQTDEVYNEVINFVVELGIHKKNI